MRGLPLLLAAVLVTLPASGQALRLVGEQPFPSELRGQRFLLPLPLVDWDGGVGPFVLYQRSVLEVVRGKLVVTGLEGAEKLPERLVPSERLCRPCVPTGRGMLSVTLYGLDRDRDCAAVVKRVTLERVGGRWRVLDVREVARIPSILTVMTPIRPARGSASTGVRYRVDVFSLGARGLDVGGVLLVPALLTPVAVGPGPRPAPASGGATGKAVVRPGREEYVILAVDLKAGSVKPLVTIKRGGWVTDLFPERRRFSTRYAQAFWLGAWDVFRDGGKRYLVVAWVEYLDGRHVLRYRVWDVTALNRPRLIRDGTRVLDMGAVLHIWGPWVLIKWWYDRGSGRPGWGTFFNVISERVVRIRDGGEELEVTPVINLPATTLEFDPARDRFILAGGHHELWLVDLRELRVVSKYVSRRWTDGFSVVGNIVFINDCIACRPCHSVALALEDVEVPRVLQVGTDRIRLERVLGRRIVGTVRVLRGGAPYTSGRLVNGDILLERPLEPGEYNLVLRYWMPMVPTWDSSVTEFTKAVTVRVGPPYPQHRPSYRPSQSPHGRFHRPGPARSPVGGRTRIDVRGGPAGGVEIVVTPVLPVVLAPRRRRS
ncbi:MAG: hypothetical protein ABGY09_03635 [Euryarchaeota archaeon]